MPKLTILIPEGELCANCEFLDPERKKCRHFKTNIITKYRRGECIEYCKCQECIILKY